MIDGLRSHPTTLAVLVVCWFTWQGLTAEGQKVKAGTGDEPLPFVEPSAVEQRPKDAPDVKVRNPFPGLVLGDEYPQPLLPGEKSDKQNAEGEGDDAEEDVPLFTIEHRPAFELRLDSLFSLGGQGGHARINGKDVNVGEPIGGCDPEDPPVLTQVSGLSARIEHRGQEYELHLDLLPLLSLGGEVIRHELPVPTEADGPLDSAVDQPELSETKEAP